MADYIDRQEVIETVAFYREDPDGIDHALSSIKNIPSADVAPVVHGHWIIRDRKRYLISCSNCDWINVHGKFDYCPICGAKMDLLN